MNPLLARSRAVMQMGAFAISALTITSAVGHAQGNLVLDPGLRIDVLDPAAVHLGDVLPLPDGDVVVAGQFLYVNDSAGHGLVRLNADGSLDEAFGPVDIDGAVYRMARGPGGTIYVIGGFTHVDGVGRTGLARLLADGSLDAAFVPAIAVELGYQSELLVPSDGGLYIVQSIPDGQGLADVHVDRLTAAGVLAPGFTPIVRLGAFLHDAAIGPDDELIVISTVNGTNTFDDIVRRYRSDGIRDPAFLPPSIELSPQNVVINADGSAIIGGNWYTTYGPSLVRLRPDGTRDDSFSGIAPYEILSAQEILVMPDGSFVVVAGGTINSPPPRVVHFSSAGVFDDTFANEAETDLPYSGLQIRGLADGGFLLFGDFGTIDGTPIAHLAQLNADGTLRDAVHTAFSQQGTIATLTPFAGGTMLVGGTFASFGEHERGNVVRLNANDAVDPGFPATDGPVNGIFLGRDGRAIVLGDFTPVTGSPAAGIFRVNDSNVVDTTLLAGTPTGGMAFGGGTAFSDGSLVVCSSGYYYTTSTPGILHILPTGLVDPDFQLNTTDTSKGPTSLIFDVAVDASDRLLLTGGDYSGPMRIQDVDLPRIARTNTSGLLDPTFVPTVGVGYGARRITPLPNGSFFVMGRRGDADLASNPTVLRFNADGSVDESFQLQIAEGEYVFGYTLTPDNALLVSTAPQRTGEPLVRRFTMTGAIDPSFTVSTGRTGTISSLAFDSLGRLWLGGSFTEINGQRRISLARFSPPDVFVAIDGPSQVVVANGGSHTLTSTVEGATGTPSYQWNLAGVAIAGATSSSLNVTAFTTTKAGAYTVTVTAGGVSRTSNPVSLVLPIAPVIQQQPLGQNAHVGGALVLRVTVTGLPPPTYQWFKDGVAIAGATQAELRLRDLTSANAGSYTVQVTNLGGTTLSDAAVLTVTPIGVDPQFVAPALAVGEYMYAAMGAGRSDNSFLLGVYQGLAVNAQPFGANSVVRILADGGLDANYGPVPENMPVPRWTMPDGTGFAIREEFPPPEGYVRYFLRKLSPAGVMDPNFGPNFGYEGNGPHAFGMLADGRMMVGGEFTTIDGQPHAGLARLLANGAVDPTFNAQNVSYVSALVVNPDNSTVVVMRDGFNPIVKKFLSTGELDPAFSTASLDSDYTVTLSRRSDGTYLLTGRFTSVYGIPRAGVARLLADGSLAGDFTGLPVGIGNLLAVGVTPDDNVRFLSRGPYYGDPFHYVRFAADGSIVTNREMTVGEVASSSSSDPNATFLPDGSLMIAGRLLTVDGHAVQGLARLDPAGNFSTAFHAQLQRYALVWTADPLDNGRWVVSGWFDAIGAVPRPGIAVLQPDGSVDPSFVPEVPDDATLTGALALSDGRLLVSGYLPPFTGNNTAVRILLRADGSRDTSHDDFLSGPATFYAVAPDGDMYFTEPNPVVNGIYTVSLRRYRPDFSVDPTFAPVTCGGPDSIRVLSDGGLFILSRNSDVVDSEGTVRRGLCRLTSGGLIDPTFTAPTLNNLYDMLPAEAPGGKYVIAGNFTSVSGVPRAAVARLNHDGSVDTSFVPPSSGLQQYPNIYQFVVGDEGEVVLWGSYTAPTPPDPNAFVLTQLNPDGTLDPGLSYSLNTFNGIQIEHLVRRKNGDLMVVGSFPIFGNATRFSIARITANSFQANAVRESVVVPEGGTGYLEVRLTGPVSLPRYQWMKDGQPVTNGDRAVLALDDFSAADVGTYRVEVSSADGSLVNSEPITVSLSTATAVHEQTPLDFAETGGLGGIRVDAPTGTNWSVTGVPAWMHVDPAPLSTGSRTVSFRLDSNRTGSERSATVNIAGQDFLVRQRASSGRLVNISTRGRVGVGDDVLIVGIITTGTQPLDFLGRGVGPTLANFGLGSVLPNPSIDLKQGSTTIGENDDWDAGTDRDLVLSEGRRLQAFDLADGAGDAAMLANLAAGAYTAKVFDLAGGQGVALAEFYDRTPSASMDPYTRAVNISTRGRVGTSDDVLIAGFVIAGFAPKQVLIRGVGPGLLPHGINDYLADPFIRVVRDGATVAENDDWGFSPQRDIVSAAIAASGAFTLDPASHDAALVVTLDPGQYTAILSGADGGAGVAIVEVYDLE